MTTSLPTTPRAIVVRGPDPSAEVEGYLDGRFIGSSTDHAQTAAEVSRAAYEAQRDDPTGVFGATAGPREGVPVLATYLEMAKARIAEAFQSSPKVLERLMWNASALIASHTLAHALAPVAQGQGLVQLSVADGKLAITDVAEPNRTTGPLSTTEARDAGTLAISRGAFAEFLAAYRSVWNTANTVWFFLDVFEGEAALEIQTDDDALSMRFDAAVI